MRTTIVFLAAALAIPIATSADQSPKDEEHAKYEFEWQVKDDHSGNDFGQNEARDGDRTAGQYHVLLPDGRKQTVTYQVEGYDGFKADVSYDGEPRQPAAHPKQYQQPQQSSANTATYSLASGNQPSSISGSPPPNSNIKYSYKVLDTEPQASSISSSVVSANQESPAGSKSFPVYKSKTEAKPTITKSFPVYKSKTEAKPPITKSFPVYKSKTEVKPKSIPVYKSKTEAKPPITKSFPVYKSKIEVKPKSIPVYKSKTEAKPPITKSFPVYKSKIEAKPSNTKYSYKVLESTKTPTKPDEGKDYQGPDVIQSRSDSNLDSSKVYYKPMPEASSSKVYYKPLDPKDAEQMTSEVYYKKL